MAAIKAVMIDREGRIWVEANTSEPGVTRLDVFDSSGEYLGNLGRLPLPAAVSGDGDILIREKTEEGLDRFSVGRINTSPNQPSGISDR